MEVVLKYFVTGAIILFFVIFIVCGSMASFQNLTFQHLQLLSDKKLKEEWERVNSEPQDGEDVGSHYYSALEMEMKQRKLL